MNSLDYLCIGHCCHDVKGQGYVLGGTASYSSVVAKQLDYSAAILTSMGNDFLFQSYFHDHDIPLYIIPAQHTTVFENIYNNNSRTQYLRKVANKITGHKINADFPTPSIVHICPIADEVDPEVVKMFPQSLKTATIQGWLRQRLPNDKVIPKEMDWQQLQNFDVVIFSNDDIKGLPHALDQIKTNTRLAVMTMGRDGAKLYSGDKEKHFPSYEVEEVDATGAGDVFTTAFLIAYHRTGDTDDACIFAHCAASFIIEGIGLEKIPFVLAINERVDQYKKDY